MIDLHDIIDSRVGVACSMPSIYESDVCVPCTRFARVTADVVHISSLRYQDGRCVAEEGTL